MKILISGGEKTQNIATELDKKLSPAGVKSIVVKDIDDIDEIYSKGTYFDRAIIIEQCWTNDLKDTNEELIRSRINKFASKASKRNTNDVSYVFLARSKESASIVQDEIMSINRNSIIVIKAEQYTVKFFVALATATFEQFPREMIYTPDINVDTDEDNSDDINTIEDTQDESTFDSQDIENIEKELFGDIIDNEQSNTEVDTQIVDASDSINIEEFIESDEFEESDEFNTDEFEESDEFNTDEFEESDEFNNSSIIETDTQIVDESDSLDIKEFIESNEFSESKELNIDEFEDSEEFNESSLTEAEYDKSDFGEEELEQSEVENEFDNKELEEIEINSNDINNLDFETEGFEDTENGVEGFEEAQFENNEQRFNTNDIFEDNEIKYEQEENYSNNEIKKKVKKDNKSAVEMFCTPLDDSLYEEESGTIKENANSIAQLNIDKKAMDIIANRGNSIVVTGCGGCGTSTIAFNIANALVNIGYTALIVDMDTEGRSQAYISKQSCECVKPESTSIINALKSGVKTVEDIENCVEIAKPGLRILTLGLGSDSVKTDSLIVESKIVKFISAAKNSHNFVIYDMPFKSAVGYAKTITNMADNIVIVTDCSNWGITKTMLAMCNIEDAEVMDTMFSTGKIMFNKYNGIAKLMGKKIKNETSILRIIDSKISEITQDEAQYKFSDMKVCYTLNFDPSMENCWYCNKQYSDTKDGLNYFLNIIQNILM